MRLLNTLFNLRAAVFLYSKQFAICGFFFSSWNFEFELTQSLNEKSAKIFYFNLRRHIFLTLAAINSPHCYRYH